MSKNPLRFNFWWRPILFLALLYAALPAAKAAPPVLLNRANSTRAIALDSLNLQREPFALNSSSLLAGQDKRTRILLFAVNISGADASMLTAGAEDGSHHHYDFKVESVGPLPGAEMAGISQLVVRFSDDLTVVGDVLVGITYQGVASNRVRVGIGYVGDGLPDDVIKIGGVVKTGTSPLANALIQLSGSLTATTVTDASGNYSFTNLTPGGSYTVSASRVNYTFSQPSQSFPFLVTDQVANFSAQPVNYTIGGRVTDNNNPLSGITVNLSGSQSATTTTDVNGNYSFSAPAEGNYMVAPTSQLYTFSPSSGFFSNLSGNQTLNFAIATRPSYSISGFVKNTDGSGLAGITITLSGSQTATVITDAAGFYAFANLSSVGNYTVTASKVGYTITPPSQSFSNLDKNQTVNFTAAPSAYIISGRITNGSGAGVALVLVTLSGSQSATTLTDANGNYSFTVFYGGSYGITPSSQLNSFSPAIQTFDNVNVNQTANFAAIDLAGFYVLDFDGTPMTVDYGDFFELQPGQTQFGPFFWEVWAMPGTNSFARYMISDGYGGAHALLFGFIGDSIGRRYTLSGNVWNGSFGTQFGSDDGPAIGEWGHFAVAWDGVRIITYFNGVPVGSTPFSGPRMPAGSGNGGGRLFIGGSDHNNFMGRIAEVRGFEGSLPFDQPITTPFRPDLIFGLNPGTRSGPPSKFLTNFLRPMLTVPDFAGGRTGVLRNTSAGAIVNLQNYPLPQYVIDPNAPTTQTNVPPISPAVDVDKPSPVPTGALIFDSFSRKNSTYAFGGHGGLGSTEGGSAGIKKWKTALVPGGGNEVDSPFGLLNGQAVPLSDFDPAYVAWVDTGTPNYYASAIRNPGFWHTGIDTSISFRVADSANFFFAYTFGPTFDPTQRKLYVGYWQNSQRTYLVTNLDMPQFTWSRLKVATLSDGTILIFANDTEVYRTNSSILANATGAGLYMENAARAPFYRWDNFTVSSAP